MAKPTLSSKTPDDSKYNSLIQIHPDIVGMPRERRFIVAEVKTREVKTDMDSGESKALLGLVHIESGLSAADAKEVEALLDRLYLKRNPGEKSRPNPNAEEDVPLDGLGAGIDDSV